MKNPQPSGNDPEDSGYGKELRAAGPLLTAGLQMALAIVVFVFVGRWLDEKLNTIPWLMLVGGFIGAGGGLYKFIKTALASGSSESIKKESQQE
jgi:ATP synthase protein I